MTLLDTDLSLLVSIETGVAVDGGGKKIRSAHILEVLQQLDVLIVEGDTGTRLYQRPLFLVSLPELGSEALLLRDGELVLYRLLKVDILTRGPAGQHFLTLFEEVVHWDFDVFDLHNNMLFSVSFVVYSRWLTR